MTPMADYPRRRQLLDQLMQDLISNKPAPLSPAAQAVKDAAQELYADRMARKMAWPLDLPVVAAALRAAADQLAPSDADEPRNYLPMAIECQRIRAELLAIAAELENQ
jgi:hypothetical protein